LFDFADRIPKDRTAQQDTTIWLIRSAAGFGFE
jgi:hypothetical protein